MSYFKIDQLTPKHSSTLLGVGTISKNCVDATINLANQYNVSVFLVASRRQIEAQEFGGGYCHCWSSEEFSRYIRSKDKKKNIIIARDHGGPWQNDFEIHNKYSLNQAMESAKRSYQIDIESGFECIHIDPSVDIFGDPNTDEVLSRAFELYEHCWKIAQKLNKKIFFEIGTEKQSGDIGTLDEVEYIFFKIKAFCQKNQLPLPTFIVIQTGTKVVEMKNVGLVGNSLKGADALQISALIDFCNRNNILLKQHNTDYLNDEILSLYPKLGVHSVNVAPEFGTRETLALVDLFNKYKLVLLKDRFLKLAFDSKKWEKWMQTQNGVGDYEKSLIAGHYVFSDPRFLEIKIQAQSELNGRVQDIDAYLVEEIKKSILRYFRNLSLIR